jgi:hypothetical protein
VFCQDEDKIEKLEMEIKNLTGKILQVKFEAFGDVYRTKQEIRDVDAKFTSTLNSTEKKMNNVIVISILVVLTVITATVAGLFFCTLKRLKKLESEVESQKLQSFKNSMDVSRRALPEPPGNFYETPINHQERAYDNFAY